MTEEVRPRRPETERKGKTRKTRRMLLGLGLDGKDGEKRITMGKNFRL